MPNIKAQQHYNNSLIAYNPMTHTYKNGQKKRDTERKRDREGRDDLQRLTR